MPKIRYEVTKFRNQARTTIERVNGIVRQYQAQGMDLTLRQIFYQCVTRNWISNNEKEYKKLGSIIAEGRMSGLIDWDAVVDRTRRIRSHAHWSTPSDIIMACATQFRLDKWARQPAYIEVWIEKDALVGVIEGVCQENDVPYMACRGYCSVSEVWRAGHMRIREQLRQPCDYERSAVILYLGDHDPSGLDMTRDVRDRLTQFIGAPYNKNLEVVRLALNEDQIELYHPPPNPSKTTDPRSKDYIADFGTESWELDALDPVVIRDLIESAIHSRRDDTLWDEACQEEEQARSNLALVANNWHDVVSGLSSQEPGEEDTD